MWRLSRDRAATEALHRDLGFRLLHFENSIDLTSRLPLRRVPEGVNLFNEDVLLQLAPAQRRYSFVQILALLRVENDLEARPVTQRRSWGGLFTC